MRRAVIIAVTGLLAGCSLGPKPSATPPQPAITDKQPVSSNAIDRLVTRLSSSPDWMNGFIQDLDLPLTASSEQVAQRALEKAQPNIGKVTSYEILEMREVRFAGWNPPFTAVHVSTNVGEKIVLFQHQEFGWWSRVYAA